MKVRFYLVFYASVMILACSRGVAGTVSIQGVGDLPGGDHQSHASGVSADGSVVVGQSSSASANEAFRWKNGVMTSLGYLSGDVHGSWAFGTSADGSVVVGKSYLAGGNQAFRWENGVMTGLGSLTAYDVSADGSVIVGCGSSADGVEALVWTNGVASGLGDLPGGDFQSHAIAVSADGQVVVGSSLSGEPGDALEAFLWRDGMMTGLGALGEGTGAIGFISCARGVSADGSVVVGLSRSDNSQWWEAFRWENGVMSSLGVPGGLMPMSEAFDVSADGSVVVGYSQIDGVSGKDAFIWTAATGMQNLREVLTGLGLDMSEWRLEQAEAISDDGMVIVGRTINPSGPFEGWIATLPEDWIDRISYELTVTIAKSDWAGWGTVTVEPNLPTYILGKAVTLTAHPNPGIAFKKWKLYEPDHAGDANYMTTDANNPITIVMTADREVKAVFRCANGMEGILPMTLGLLALCVLTRRRL